VRNALLSFMLGAAAVGASGQFVGGFDAIPIQPAPSTLASPITNALSASEIPLWTYSVTAGADLGSGTYSGKIVGRNPHLPGKTTTTIPLLIIPVKVIINNGVSDTHTYDPLVYDGCEPVGHTAVDIVQNSPVFTNSAWNIDGVNVGTTQYHDAVVRASFWSLVAGSSYHLVENATVLSEQTLTFGSSGTSGPGTNYNNVTSFGGCGFEGVVNENDLVTAINSLLATISQVNIGTLPMILVNGVVSASSGDVITANCCALGFHTGYASGPNFQVTSIFNIDYSGIWNGGNVDVSVISHELGEAIFDPEVNNTTPIWGNEGQVEGGCPGSGGYPFLEVGDPLSPGYPTTTNEWVVTGGNGLTYHLQELAFFSWFFGGTNLGISGHYSSHGTFTGNAKLCSAGGGTN